MTTAHSLTEHRRRIDCARAHLEHHLDAPLDLAVLAEVAGLSPFHFHRVFRALVGEPVIAHLRRLRLERAARRLRHGEAPIVELAFEAGFSSHEAFTRAFAAQFGVPPSAYRRAHHAAADAADFELGPVPADFARIEDRDAARVLALRHVGPYASVGAAWARLFAWLGERGVTPLGAPVGLSFDDPEVTPEGRIRYEACVPVSAGVVGGGDVRPFAIEAGRYAVALHRGPFDTLSDGYARLTRWALERDRSLGDAPAVERSLDLPGAVDPAAQRTEISLRIGGDP